MKNLIGLFSVIVSVALVSFLTMAREQPEPEHNPQSLINVPINKLYSQPATSSFIGYGQVQPRWQTTLSSEVTGRVTYVSDKFLSGQQLLKGEVLATIDDTSYVAALKNQQALLASTKRALIEEQQRAEIAAEDWRQSGLNGQASDLVLRKPQLDELKLSIKSIEAAINKAKYDLQQTKITAPYNGTVISRSINPGDFLQMGTEVGQIYDHSLYEISVPLSQQQISQLDMTKLTKQSVTLTIQRSKQSLSGHISRLERVIDQQSRWQNIIIQVTANEKLLPGQFISVAFTGKHYDNVFVIEESMLSEAGDLWFLDKQANLQRFSPDVLFKNQGKLYINADVVSQHPLHITKAQAFFLPGIKVNPISDQPSQVVEVTP